MNEINIHNYEAFFLDFCEGTMEPERVELLEAFLQAHPELRAELDEFEAMHLSDETEPAPGTWNELRRPDLEVLKSDIDAREALYCSAVENQLNPAERILLDSLLLETAFAREFEIWKKLRLQAGEDHFEEKDGVYRFGLDEPIGLHNYEAYLIAFGEKILDTEQIARLEAFAKTLPEGSNDLRMAKSLSLKPARGIVFPDKASLRKEQKAAPLIWLYRAAAVILLGGAVWFLLPDNGPQIEPISEIAKEIPADTLASPSPPLVPKDSLIEGRQPRTPSRNVEEWEVREPDPVEYAQVQNELKPQENEEFKERIPSVPEEFPKIEQIQPREAELSTPTLAQSIQPADPEIETEDAKDPEIREDKYKTLADLAEQKLGDKLALNDAERDALAMSIAKRITDKAGEMLDAEVQRESQQAASGERITYTLRVGGFKVSHNKAK